jgi:signal transduction histidine kinase
MERILSLILTSDNIRMLIILAFVCCGYVLIIKRIDGVEYSLNKQIDDLRHNDLAAINKRIDELKYNDFAHLSSAFEALTYVLEKNDSMKKEDKEYVDSRLAH